MTVFDDGILVLMLLSGLLAMARGFLNETLSILSWIVGALLTLFAYPYVYPVAEQLTSPSWLAALLTGGSVFLAGYLGTAFLTRHWTRALREKEIHFLDRLAGLLYGILRALILVATAYLVFAWLVPERKDHPDWVKRARFIPIVETLSYTIANLLPGDNVPAALRPPNESGTDTDENTGYKPDNRQDLDRLYKTLK